MRLRVFLSAVLTVMSFGSAASDLRAQSPTGGYQSGFGFLPSWSRFNAFYSYGPATSLGGYTFTPNLAIAPAWVQTNPDVWTYAPAYRYMISGPVYPNRYYVTVPVTPPTVAPLSNVYAPAPAGANPVQGPAAPTSPPVGGLGMPKTVGGAVR